MIRACVQCGREFGPRRAELLCSDECHRQRHNARARAYYAANRERVRATATAWNEANHERMLATDKVYREANREWISAQNKAYREKNADRLRAKRRELRRLRNLEFSSNHRACRRSGWPVKVLSEIRRTGPLITSTGSQHARRANL